LRGNLLLFFAAFIWGTAFVAQRKGLEVIGPFTFNAVRSVVGSIFLVPVILVRNHLGQTERHDKIPKSVRRKKTVVAGAICGLILFLATSAQQVGLVYSGAGKAGFMTAMYVVLVPILGLLFRRRPKPVVWLAALIALAGLYLLCVKEGFSIAKEDLPLLACALLFAMHITVVDLFSPYVDGVVLSCIQFAVTAVLSGIVMFAAETPDFSAILSAAGSILYAGVLSSGIAYTFQILGQRDASPSLAALIMSLESVFAALAGWVVLNENLSTRELFGSVLMFTAIVLAELPDKKQRKE